VSLHVVDGTQRVVSHHGAIALPHHLVLREVGMVPVALSLAQEPVEHGNVAVSVAWIFVSVHCLFLVVIVRSIVRLDDDAQHQSDDEGHRHAY